MTSQKDKTLLRELAKRYAEIANHPANVERYERGRDINDLKPRRPMVWLDEIPWHEMDIDGNLKLHCESDQARGMEQFLRRTLYRWEYIQADMVVDNYYSVQKAYSNSGFGLEVEENIISSDDNNNIVSHYYLDQLDTMEKVNALKEPVITAFPESDKERVAFAEEILGDIMPVKLRGHYVYHAPWDQIPRHRGVTPIMYDLVDNPELLHATIKKWTDYSLSSMKQMEALGLLDTNIPSLHCTPPYTSDLPQGTGLKNIWFRCMAQMFSDIAPDMWKEFELDYLLPLTKEFGLVYYGCCEAMERKLDMLKAIPNLRKIGVPARANPESCAEQMGGDYVFAHKPNPAFVATSFDKDIVQKEITRIIDTCRANNCPYEFVIKDISTVGYKPQNLIDWNKTTMETIDKYY